MAIPVKLPVFEGPLDLLMHLIEKNKIDIYDIPIAEITDQYLEYVRQMDHEDMDVTSEFLVMAATLLDIKSRMLLPREKDEETGEEEADPREELVQRLLEYKMYKYLSEELAVRREETGVRYFRAQNLPREVRSYQPPIDYNELLKGTDLQSLQKVFGEVLRRKKSRRDPIRSGFGKIRREQVNMDTKALYIRAYLQTHPQTDFRALLESQKSREEVIVTFLILLELMKTQQVHIVQDTIGGRILVESAAAEPIAAMPADTEPVDAAPADEKPADPDSADFEPEDAPEAEDLPEEPPVEKDEPAYDDPAVSADEDDSISDTAEDPAPEADEFTGSSVRTISSTFSLSTRRNPELVEVIAPAGSQPQEDSPAEEKSVENEPAENIATEETETASPAFSKHLWHGTILQGSGTACASAGWRACVSPASLGLTGWASGPDQIRIRRALWERDRMSRLWAGRPFPNLPDLPGC